MTISKHGKQYVWLESEATIQKVKRFIYVNTIIRTIFVGIFFWIIGNNL